MEGTASTRRFRRVLLLAVPLAICGWLALSHFVVRREIEAYLSYTFAGESKVRFALLWPNLDATAFGVSIQAEHHRLEAARVGIGLRVWGFFGGRMVSDVEIHDLYAEFEEGRPVRLFTWSEGGAAEAAVAGDGEADDEIPFDLEPLHVPRLALFNPRVALRSPERTWMVFGTRRLDALQVGDRTFRLEMKEGVLAEVPFEKLTGQLIPRAGHLLLSQLKLRAFNGVVGGLLDIDTLRAGAFNGEIELHLVEVEKVWTTYRLPYAEKRRGDLTGRIVFRGARPTLDALQGKGELSLARAAFFSPLSFKVFLFLKVPVAAEAPLTRGELTFSFEQSLLYLERARFLARGFELEGQGILSFDGAADLEVSHSGTTVAISGRIEDPTIRVLPLNHITVPFDRIFRERVR